MKSPLLTIVTRCCQRPQMLRQNIASVQMQIDKDIEQLFIVDMERRGRLWANKQLAICCERISGEYVYIIDDDCRLVSSTFVSGLKQFLRREQPDVVMVHCRRPQKMPKVLPRTWGDVSKLRGKMANCLCYVVRRNRWCRHVGAFGQGVSGAGRFLDALLNNGASVGWLNMVVAETLQLGRDDPDSFEEVEDNWWEECVHQYAIRQSDDGWKIQHWTLD